MTGAASVSTKPDRASLSLGVQSRRPRAHSAMRDVDERAATLISALRDAGARDEDLRTTGLSLWFDQTEREYSASYTVTRQPSRPTRSAASSTPPPRSRATS